MSKFLDFTDHKIATLFADGAGAVVVRQGRKKSGMITSKLIADGQYHDYMGIYAGGTFMPTTKEAIDRKDNLLRFAKKIPLETNATYWPGLVHILLERMKKAATRHRSLLLHPDQYQQHQRNTGYSWVFPTTGRTM